MIIAVGAKRSRALGLPGERGPRVYGGVDLLRAVAVGEPIDLGHDVVVIGGGNVAYDVARTVVRQAAYDTARTAARLPGTRRVRLVSLETLEEMPADTVEIREGDEEGVERLNGWGPVEIQRDDQRQRHRRRLPPLHARLRRAASLQPDLRRRRSPDGRVRHGVDRRRADDRPGASCKDGGTDVEEFRPGWPKVDAETLATTAPGVFVAGDLAHGTRLLIDAVASGKKAARSVYRYVTGRAIRPEAVEAHIPLERYRREFGYEAHPARRAADAGRRTSGCAIPARCVELGYARGAGAPRGVALSRLRRHAGLRRHALRALRRLRRRLPDLVPEAGVARRRSSRRRTSTPRSSARSAPTPTAPRTPPS